MGGMMLEFWPQKNRRCALKQARSPRPHRKTNSKPGNFSDYRFENPNSARLYCRERQNQTSAAKAQKQAKKTIIKRDKFQPEKNHRRMAEKKQQKKVPGRTPEVAFHYTHGY